MYELIPLSVGCKRWISTNLRIEDWQKTKNGSILYDNVSWWCAKESLQRQGLVEEYDYEVAIRE